MESASRLKPLKDFRVYRRNLPHWELPGSVYFITFRTADDVLLNDNAKDIAFASIKFHVNKKYKLYAVVVMETHVHILLQPLNSSKDAFFSLAQIMHSIKSYSANRIQRELNQSGSVWQPENYDRIIRNDSDYLENMNYIIFNPVKAGKVNKPEDYKWLFYQGSE